MKSPNVLQKRIEAISLLLFEILRMTLVILLIFITGYFCIAFEHSLKINKAAIALITGVLCWTIHVLNVPSKEPIIAELLHHLADISQILFFLMGAMTIVELIDAHDGFEIITRRIKTTKKSSLLWIIGLLSFFLSAVLDNLTTTIVMISLVRKLVSDKKDTWVLLGLIVIAANAGGAWSPIGDVTTTMLWIGGQITAVNIMLKVFLPSLICASVPILILQFSFKGNVTRPTENFNDPSVISSTAKERSIIFFAGIIILLMVPVFKTITHLPPFMGMLLGLGVMWIISEILHSEKDEADRKNFTVAYALRKIDTASVLFFLGILLAITSLEATGQLQNAAVAMDKNIGDVNLIVIGIGLLSAIVDNVPLVAAAMGMYDLNQYPTDHYFWEFLAYTTGTGGSALIIGSAAGVAAMGMEKINFMWYLRKISLIALAGFFAGVIVYILQKKFIG